MKLAKSFTLDVAAVAEIRDQLEERSTIHLPIGEVLVDCLRATGTTKAALASAVKMSENRVSAITRGTATITPTEAIAIAGWMVKAFDAETGEPKASTKPKRAKRSKTKPEARTLVSVLNDWDES